MSEPVEGTTNTGRVLGQQKIDLAAEELIDIVQLFVDETDNKEQILEFITQIVEAGGALFQLKSAFLEDDLGAVGAHLALAIADRIVSIFVPVPVPKE